MAAHGFLPQADSAVRANLAVRWAAPKRVGAPRLGLFEYAIAATVAVVPERRVIEQIEVHRRVVVEPPATVEVHGSVGQLTIVVDIGLHVGPVVSVAYVFVVFAPPPVFVERVRVAVALQVAEVVEVKLVVVGGQMKEVLVAGPGRVDDVQHAAPASLARDIAGHHLRVDAPSAGWRPVVGVHGLRNGPAARMVGDRGQPAKRLATAVCRVFELITQYAEVAARHAAGSRAIRKRERRVVFGRDQHAVAGATGLRHRLGRKQEIHRLCRVVVGIAPFAGEIRTAAPRTDRRTHAPCMQQRGAVAVPVVAGIEHVLVLQEEQAFFRKERLERG